MSKRHVVAAAAVAASLLAVRSRRAQTWDRRAGVALSHPLGTEADTVISAATDLGSVYAIAGLATTLAATGRRRAAARVVGAGLTGWTVAQAIKPLVDRPRPYEAHGAVRLVAAPAGASWPSGHVAVAAAMSSALTDELPKPAKGAAALSTLFVGYSRIYVGVHYLSDVAAGMALGVLSERVWRATVSGLTRLRDRLRR